MMQQDILRQVLQAKGLNPDEVLAEVSRRQQIGSVLTRLGKDVASLIGKGNVTIEVTVKEDGTVIVSATKDLQEKVEFKLTQQDEGSKSTRDGKGSKIVEKLDAAAKRQGLELKEWQKRSIAFHFPQIVKSLIKQKEAIKTDTDLIEAVRMYAEWHPERKGELPQDILTQNDAETQNAETQNATA
jgi:hypothetical protein